MMLNTLSLSPPTTTPIKRKEKKIALLLGQGRAEQGGERGTLDKHCASNIFFLFFFAFLQLRQVTKGQKINKHNTMFYIL